MRRTGIKKDSLSGGRLARVDVSNDPDVPDLFDGSGHLAILFRLKHKKPGISGCRVFLYQQYQVRAQQTPGIKHSLPCEVSKRLIGIGHTVYVFSLGDRGAFTTVGGHQLFGEPAIHGATLLVATNFQDPANRQRLLTL